MLLLLTSLLLFLLLVLRIAIILHGLVGGFAILGIRVGLILLILLDLLHLHRIDFLQFCRLILDLGVILDYYLFFHQLN